jgi:hypothetical protein
VSSLRARVKQLPERLVVRCRSGISACGGSKSESGSEREGSRCLDIDQSFGDFDRRALSLAAGVSRGVAIEKLGAGGKVGGKRHEESIGYHRKVVKMGQAPGRVRCCWMFLRLRRNLGNTGALVDVNDDEPGMGPLPTPPPSISSVVAGREGK